jgi:hypothetical protein
MPEIFLIMGFKVMSHPLSYQSRTAMSYSALNRFKSQKLEVKSQKFNLFLKKEDSSNELNFVSFRPERARL